MWPTYLGSAMEFYEMGAYLQAGAALQHNFFEQPGSSKSATAAALGVRRSLILPPLPKDGPFAIPFPHFDPSTAPLSPPPPPPWPHCQVWVGHSCTFLVRPVGGLLFGWVGDKFGRRVSMLITLIGML